MRYVGFFQVIILSLIVGCSVSEKDNSYKDTMSVIDEYSKFIKNENGIKRLAYGLDYADGDKVYDGKIHVISLGYCVDKNMKYGEGREYFYSIVDGLISRINENTYLQKYFYHYPIDYSDLEFHLSFENDKNGFLKRNDLHSIHIYENEIFYEIVNEEGPDEIEKDQISSDICITKGFLERNRSIIRSVQEDLGVYPQQIPEASKK